MESGGGGDGVDGGSGIYGMEMGFRYAAGVCGK